jgi:hypothetical protein
MRRLSFFTPVLAGYWLLAVQPLLANVQPARVPLPTAVETADCIVIGKVTLIEEKSVQAPPFPGATVQVEYRIAVVKIDERLKGAMGLTEVRIAFQPPPPAPPPQPAPKPGQPIRVGPRPVVGTTLAVGNEGCFLLVQHKDETYFRNVDRHRNDFIAKTDNEFDSKVQFIKRALKLLDDPAAGLQSKEAADRLLTAYLLLTRFQKGASAQAKAEPIDAAQSKLILETIAAADWAPRETTGEQITPQGAFQLLRLTAKDWNPPKPKPNQDYRIFQKEWNAAAQKWVKDNAAAYRISRWVAEKSEK